MDELQEGEIYSLDPNTVFVHKFQVSYSSFPSDPEHQADAPIGVACSVTGHLLAADTPDSMQDKHFVFDINTAARFAGAITEILILDIAKRGGENREGD